MRERPPVDLRGCLLFCIVVSRTYVCTRCRAVTISTAAAALTSLAKLSLSGTPPPQTSTTFVSAAGEMDPVSTKHNEGPKDDELELNGTGISVTSAKSGTGKKRGTIFKCESCSKVYRHPSCLIKHRWEHSPHWREASKLLLSKHQQVQLLEAAAILSHLSPSATGGTSLPEDRSLWPSYLSGGLLPPPSTANAAASPSSSRPTMSSFPIEPPAAFAVSSSVPAPAMRASPRAGSTGPRLHDYAVPVSGGVTQLRPGVLAVPTIPAQYARSTAIPMPNAHAHAQRAASFASQPSDAWSSPVSASYAQSFRSSVSRAGSARERSYSDGAGGWSLPRSSMRSGSRSASEESELVDVDGLCEDVPRGGVGREKIEEEWDGMEMEMEM